MLEVTQWALRLVPVFVGYFAPFQFETDYFLQISFISVVLFSVFVVRASVVLKSDVGSSRIQI